MLDFHQLASMSFARRARVIRIRFKQISKTLKINNALNNCAE
jgi:hypothetical protein